MNLSTPNPLFNQSWQRFWYLRMVWRSAELNSQIQQPIDQHWDIISPLSKKLDKCNMAVQQNKKPLSGEFLVLSTCPCPCERPPKAYRCSESSHTMTVYSPKLVQKSSETLSQLKKWWARTSLLWSIFKPNLRDPRHLSPRCSSAISTVAALWEPTCFVIKWSSYTPSCMQGLTW